LDKLQKQEAVKSIKETLLASKSIIITHYHGLSVSDLTELRSQMRKVGVGYTIVKNSLAKLAVIDTDYAQLGNLLEGPTAIAFSADPVAAVKALISFAKTKENLKIIGGVVEKQLVDEKAIQMLSTIPSLDELRAKIIGTLSAPATKIVGILQAPVAQLARVINAYASKN
jgi:large subunit ribosomal protein L10